MKIKSGDEASFRNGTKIGREGTVDAGEVGCEAGGLGDACDDGGNEGKKVNDSGEDDGVEAALVEAVLGWYRGEGNGVGYLEGCGSLGARPELLVKGWTAKGSKDSRRGERPMLR